MIWRAWLLVRPVLEHLLRQRIGLRDRIRPILMSYPYKGHLKRAFEDEYLALYSYHKAKYANKSIMEIVAEAPPFEFYLESPQPHRWIRRDA